MAALVDAPRIDEMPQDVEQMSGQYGDAQIVRRGNRATVDFNPGASRFSQDDSDEHSANILHDLDQRELADLANNIIEWVDVDLDSRKDWEQRMDQAMELMGLNNIPTEELPFDGASAVTYPLIGEAVVQFQSRAIEEVFPSEGPVKVKMVGEATREKTRSGRPCEKPHELPDTRSGSQLLLASGSDAVLSTAWWVSLQEDLLR